MCSREAFGCRPSVHGCDRDYHVQLQAVTSVLYVRGEEDVCVGDRNGGWNGGCDKFSMLVVMLVRV